MAIVESLRGLEQRIEWIRNQIASRGQGNRACRHLSRPRACLLGAWGRGGRAVNLIFKRYGDTARAESAKRADDLAATGNDAGAAKLSPDAAAPSRQSSTTGSFADRCPGADGGVCVRLDVTSFAGHIGHNAAARPYR
jgi:hypothetical protein